MDNREPRLAEMIAVVSKESHEIERLLGQLDALILRDETKQSAWLAVIGKLSEICIEHIDNEENLMRAIRYNMLEKHCDDHQIILDIFAKSLADCERFQQCNLVASSRAVREALYSHIAHHDDPLLDAVREVHMQRV